MSVVYLPVYKIAIGYTVSYGRRWSVLEHLLLFELAGRRYTVNALANAADLPDRLIVEALINLLRAAWVEVRTTDNGAFFSATAAGKRRIAQEELPVELKQRVRWISLCVDRLTGSWLRGDDLDLTYEKDLPADATKLEAIASTFDPEDESRRDLVYLDRDETFEKFSQSGRFPVRAYARLEIVLGNILGLPSYASIALRDQILEDGALESQVEYEGSPVSRDIIESLDVPSDDLTADDVIVGGAEHLELLKDCLRRAKSQFVLHSCFLSPSTVESLLPFLEAAAQRKVSIDLLWGLRVNPDDIKTQPQITQVKQVLDKLTPTARKRVQLSPASSGSHAKVIVYDDRDLGEWVSVVGSCNFLSSLFAAIEISLRSRSALLAAQLIGQMIAAQLPASGVWPPVARRLNRSWNAIRQRSDRRSEIGSHSIQLLIDDDHYACIRTARNEARKSIVVGSDYYGTAAETSIIPPMVRATELGAKVRLLYRRPSPHLIEVGRSPPHEQCQDCGISLEQVSDLHGKFLIWDESSVAISSFNWMSSVADGTRVKGAELGVLVRGPTLRAAFAGKLADASGGQIIS